MAVQIMSNRDGSTAIMFCNTTGWAFGPVNRSEEYNASQELWMFINNLPRDAREYSSKCLESKYSKFRSELKHCECGEPLMNGTQCCLCRDAEAIKKEMEMLDKAAN